jgi:hypothetical protein
MKDYNEIDKLFEEQLGDMRVEPSDKAWANISSGLDAAAMASAQSAKRKKRMWLWFGLGAAAAILAYIFFINRSDAQVPANENTPLVKQEQSFENAAPLTSDKQAAEPSTEVAHDVSQTTPSGGTADKENTEIKTTPVGVTESREASKPIANSNQNNTAANSQSETNKKAQATATAGVSSKELQAPEKSNAKAVNSTQEIAKADNLPATGLKEDAVQSEAGNKAVNAADQPVVAVAMSEQTTNNQKENIAASQEKANNARGEKPEENAVASTESRGNEAESATVVTEAEQNNAVQEEQVQANELPSEPTAPEPGEVSGIHYATGWSVELLGGPAWIFSNEKAEYEEGSPVMTPGPPASIAVPSVELHLMYHINNWFIRSGLAYAEYGENRTFSQKLEMHDTSGYSKMEVKEYYSYDSTGIYIDPSGVIVIMYDAIRHSDTSYKWITEDSLYYQHKSIQVQNRYRYIEIPLMIGYEFRFKNLSVQVSTGVSYGFRVNSTGKFLDSQNNLVDIAPGNSPYTNQMMNYILSVGVNYHLNRRLSVSVQPTYKTNINSLFAGDNSNIRYNHYGVNMGINYIIK